MPRLKLSRLDANRKLFSDYVTYRAAKAGTTISAIGKAIAISETTMHKYKKNPGKMRVDDLLKLSNALNVDAAALLRVYSEGKEPWEV